MALSTLGSIFEPARSTVDAGAGALPPVARPAVTGSHDANGADRIVAPAAAASPDLATVAMVLRPPGDAYGSVAGRSTEAKLQSAAASGMAEAARHTQASAGRYLRDPAHRAAIGGGIAALAAVQAVPGADGAVDATVAALGAATYAAAGPEHRANVEKALDELKQYATAAAGATSQPELDDASHHFATFLEIGGPEVADALATLAATPMKLGGAASKGVATSTEAISHAATAMQGSLDAATRWLDETASGLAPTRGPALAPSGARFETGTGTLERRGLEPPRDITARPTSSRAATPDRSSVETHDAAGGHTEAEHVGKSRRQLAERLEENPRIKEASSFPNRSTADFAQATLVKHSRTAMLKYFDSGDIAPLVVEADTGRDVGCVLDRTGAFGHTTKVRGVIVRDTSPQGWHFLTSFPIKNEK